VDVVSAWLIFTKNGCSANIAFFLDGSHCTSKGKGNPPAPGWMEPARLPGAPAPASRNKDLAFSAFIWPFPHSYGLFRIHMALSAFIWPYPHSYGLIRIHTAFPHSYGLIRNHMAFSAIIWPYLQSCGLSAFIWPFPHSYGFSTLIFFDDDFPPPTPRNEMRDLDPAGSNFAFSGLTYDQYRSPGGVRYLF